MDDQNQQQEPVQVPVDPAPTPDVAQGSGSPAAEEQPVLPPNPGEGIPIDEPIVNKAGETEKIVIDGYEVDDQGQQLLDDSGNPIPTGWHKEAVV